MINLLLLRVFNWALLNQQSIKIRKDLCKRPTYKNSVTYGDINTLIAGSRSSSNKRSMAMITASFTILSKPPRKDNNGSPNPNSPSSLTNPIKSPNLKKNTSTNFYTLNKSTRRKKNNGRSPRNHTAKTSLSSNPTSPSPNTIFDPTSWTSNSIVNSKPNKKNKAKNTSITSTLSSKSLAISSSKTHPNFGNSSCSISSKKYKSVKTNPTKTFTTNSTWSSPDKLWPSSILSPSENKSKESFMTANWRNNSKTSKWTKLKKNQKRKKKTPNNNLINGSDKTTSKNWTLLTSLKWKTMN